MHRITTWPAVCNCINALFLHWQWITSLCLLLVILPTTGTGTGITGLHLICKCSYWLRIFLFLCLCFSVIFPFSIFLFWCVHFYFWFLFANTARRFDVSPVCMFLGHVFSDVNFQFFYSHIHLFFFLTVLRLGDSGLWILRGWRVAAMGCKDMLIQRGCIFIWALVNCFIWRSFYLLHDYLSFKCIAGLLSGTRAFSAKMEISALAVVPFNNKWHQILSLIFHASINFSEIRSDFTLLSGFNVNINA